MALTIGRNTNTSGAHVLEFEGITVRSDVLNILQATVGVAMSGPELSRLRGRSSGSTLKTLLRFVELGLVRELTKRVTLGGRYASRERTVAAYQATDKAVRLLQAAANLQAELKAHEDESDPELTWSRIEPDVVVSQALRTQPSSVFDLGRLALADEPPPVVAQPQQRSPANSVWALAAA